MGWGKKRYTGKWFIASIFFIVSALCFFVLCINTVSAASIFQNVTIEPIKDTSAVIKWEVSGDFSIEYFTTSQIEYGLDTNYGYLTEEDDLAYFHRHELKDLSPGTTYHFRIRAKDYYGNEYISEDYTFTTLTKAEMDALVKAAREDGGLPKTYYVSPDGDDSNDGLTPETAFKTISKGLSVLDAGDTLIVKAGTYHETAQGLQHSGIPTHPIKIVADGEVILDGQNTLENGFWIDVRHGRYNKIIIAVSYTHLTLPTTERV